MKFLSSSSKPTIDDLKNEHGSAKFKYKDVEEADFREIKPEDDKEDKNN